MRPGPILVLATMAVAGALTVEARGGPDIALTALLVIASVLLALVVMPAMGRRWPGETAPTRGTQLVDQPKAIGRGPSPR
jgi:multisubunit Na+/H+ antiporter MnhB subunit